MQAIELIEKLPVSSICRYNLSLVPRKIRDWRPRPPKLMELDKADKDFT